VWLGGRPQADAKRRPLLGAEPRRCAEGCGLTLGQCHDARSCCRLGLVATLDQLVHFVLRDTEALHELGADCAHVELRRRLLVQALCKGAHAFDTGRWSCVLTGVDAYTPCTSTHICTPKRMWGRKLGAMEVRDAAVREAKAPEHALPLGL
jgi:hypothetical protein